MHKFYFIFSTSNYNISVIILYINFKEIKIYVNFIFTFTYFRYLDHMLKKKTYYKKKTNDNFFQKLFDIWQVSLSNILYIILKIINN